MSISLNRVQSIIREFEKIQPIEEYVKQLSALSEEEVKGLPSESFAVGNTKEGADARVEFLENKGNQIDYLKGKNQFSDVQQMDGNIENYIGMAQVPVGLAGPMLINGIQARGDFFVPLATTEGALVASYSRGMKACRLSGGITTVCLSEGLQRSPLFKFTSIGEVAVFIKWVQGNMDQFKEIVSRTTNHGKLRELKFNTEGNSVILTLEYTTGDAAGQNMVTVCTDQICKYILKNIPVQPIEWYVESNYSGDKKATALSFTNVRGKKVIAETTIKRWVVEKILKATPEAIADYWRSSTLAVLQSGAIGAQGHIANGLTALFIACGQDVACVAESSVGVTRMEVTSSGDLYVSITLPALIVGTVGGGTGLPTQSECLDMLGCKGAGGARKFAEICCATVLAGEISIASALAMDHFTSAHEKLGRNK